MKTKFTPVLGALLMALGAHAQNASAPGAATAKVGLVPQEQRIADETILADRQSIETLQQRLKKLNEAGLVLSNYSMSKAQCWLDTAKSQYHENDRTGYIEESLAESLKIIKALEVNKQAHAGYMTPLVARSELIRPDLWERFEAFKRDVATLSCTARTVACAEVRLVRAGHAQEQTGWRQALPHVQMAEDAVAKAEREAKACSQPAAVTVSPPVVAAAPAVAPVVPAPVVVPSPPPPAPKPAAAERKSFVLTGDALFQYKKFGREDMLPGGLDHLDAVIQQLKGYAQIDSLTVTGHTDRFANQAYNDKLSKQRAQTVYDYLLSKGVKAGKVEIIGMGKRQPVTADKCSDKLPKPEAVVCLQPDRRVVIEVKGLVK